LEPVVVGGYRTMSWTRQDSSYLLGLLALALVLGLARSALGYWHVRLVEESAADLAVDLRRRLFVHQAKLGGVAIDLEFRRRFSELLRDEVDAVEAGVRAWGELIPCEPARLVALALAAMALNAWLGLTFVLLAALAYTIGRGAVRQFQAKREALASRAAAGLDRLLGLAGKTRLIEGYAADAYIQAHYERRLREHRQDALGAREFRSRQTPLWTVLGLVVLLTLVGVAAQNVLTDRFGLSAAAGVSAALLGIAWAGARNYLHRRTLTDGERAAAVVDSFLAQSAERTQREGGAFLPTLAKSIDFVEASYRDASGRLLLDGVACQIPAGARVAVLATDPAEARAFLDLLLRFVEPTSGSVRFDGVDVRAYTLESLRAQVCTVLGDEVLFPDTVAKNIGCGDPSFSRERIAEAAKVAHAHSFVERLPGGYDCLVGEGGRRLTHGEAYRIGLARAILRDPAVAALEEPLAPFDPDTDHLLDDTMRRFLKRRTSILVPQRWGTLALAERVIVLDRGRVVAAGPHAELFAENPVYRFLLLARFADRVDRGALAG
jgi:ABC-type multidrug transport system fused ATPase/permease subunit